MRLWGLIITAVAAAWLIGAYAGTKPSTVTPTTAGVRSNPEEDAAQRERVRVQREAEKLKRDRIEAGIARLAANGITRDDLKDYFFDEIEEEVRDASQED